MHVQSSAEDLTSGILLDDVVIAKWPLFFTQEDKNVEDLQHFFNKLTDGRIAEVGVARGRGTWVWSMS